MCRALSQGSSQDLYIVHALAWALCCALVQGLGQGLAPSVSQPRHPHSGVEAPGVALRRVAHSVASPPLSGSLMALPWALPLPSPEASRCRSGAPGGPCASGMPRPAGVGFGFAGPSLASLRWPGSPRAATGRPQTLASGIPAGFAAGPAQRGGFGLPWRAHQGRFPRLEGVKFRPWRFEGLRASRGACSSPFQEAGRHRRCPWLALRWPGGHPSPQGRLFLRRWRFGVPFY